MSAHGARKGLSDTALRTADSGYLTRRLVDVSQHMIVRESDCCAGKNREIPGMVVKAFMEGKEEIESLEERITGRFACETICDKDGNVIVKANHMITPRRAAAVVTKGVDEKGEPITSVKIRTILTCRSHMGVCAKCYGSNMATGQAVQVGEAIGIIAAQSIGEPGTQLTMRTFHTGGIASAEDITQGLPRVEELFEGRRPKNAAILARMSGRVQIEEVNKTRNVVLTNLETGETETYMIPYNFKIRVRPGQDIEKGEKLTEGNIYPTDILNILGPQAVQNYIIDEVQKVYRLQGVDINDKHIEVIVRQMLRKIKVEDSGSSYLLPGALVDSKEVAQINEEIQERINNGEETLSLVTTTPVLQGITKASSSSESFLSAASFQETTKALTDAAIRGKSDHLLGLKENVIIGKLVPAGTGMDIYNKVQVVKNEGYLEHAAAASNSATML